MTEENQPSQDAASTPAPMEPAPIESAPIEPAAQVAALPTAEAPAQWPSAPVPPPGTPAGYPAAAIPPPPGAGYYPPAPKTSSNAIIALVLSIASWAICPIVPAIVALVFASMATREIDATGGQLEGRGLVTAAKIVAWINIGFWAAMIVIGAFVLVIIAIAGGMSDVRTT